MDDQRIAVVGIGATGAVLAAALLKQDPDTILVDPRPGLGEELRKKGLAISGELSYHVPVRHFFERIEEMKARRPNLIFVSTKTFHLPSVLESLKEIYEDGTTIVSTHNGLGPEDVIGEAFGAGAAFRMSLNFGVVIEGTLRGPDCLFQPAQSSGSPDPRKPGNRFEDGRSAFQGGAGHGIRG